MSANSRFNGQHKIVNLGWVSPVSGKDQIEVKPRDVIYISNGTTYLRYQGDPNNEIKIKRLSADELDELTNDKAAV